VSDAADDDPLEAILGRWRHGGCSPEVALMDLMIECESLSTVEDAVRGEPVLAALLAANRAGCARICAMLRRQPLPGAAASIEEEVASVRRLFDRTVEEDEPSSVAMYSLGSEEILARATDEVVRVLDGWGVLGPGGRALEIGCGIGRLLGPVASRVGQVVGIDVSPRMVEAARRRTAGDPRVEVRTSSGADLGGAADRAFELVYAVDSFPYAVDAGPALVRALFSEVVRVLVPGGWFALCNYSYRGDDAADRRDVEQVAREVGLEVIVAGERPFTLWNALAFLLRG
jgi:SAM-dependent methyltransferase